MRTLSRSLMLALVFPCVARPSAFAQSTTSHWGVLFSVTPEWEIPKEAKELFLGEPQDVKGREFRIGVVRGRSLSGDWGLSVFRRTLRQRSVFSDVHEECYGQFGCGPAGIENELQNGRLTGIEIHKFTPFGTIARRVQIGLEIAAGVARFEGTSTEYEYSPLVTDSRGITIGTRPDLPGRRLGETLAEDLFIIKPVPTAQLELSIAGIVTPYIKVRVSGGLSFPGYHRAAISLVHLPMSRGR